MFYFVPETTKVWYEEEDHLSSTQLYILDCWRMTETLQR